MFWPHTKTLFVFNKHLCLLYPLCCLRQQTRGCRQLQTKRPIIILTLTTFFTSAQDKFFYDLTPPPSLGSQTLFIAFGVPFKSPKNYINFIRQRIEIHRHKSTRAQT